MKFLLAFMLGTVFLSIWEARGGPRWRPPVVLVACGIFAFLYTSLRFVS